jgi:NADH-quinone oxidoreductase subunit M
MDVIKPWLDTWLLTVILFLPMAGALLAWLARGERAIRVISLATMVLGLVLGVVLWLAFDPSRADMQFEPEARLWFKLAGNQIHYSVGVDGVSILLVELTLLLGPVVILSSWSQIQERVKEYHMFMLVLQTGMLGAFMALDLFLFYVFWELMLVPMYFLIGVWGGPRRVYAAIKFFLFTMAGSVLMLIAILYIAYTPMKSATGAEAMAFLGFDIVTLTNTLTSTPLTPHLQIILFAAFALAFAIKVPMFPFHTWLPDAHVEAPTAGSVILAGVLLKMGTYGFIRFAMPLFPYAAYEMVPLISILAIIGIIYGALVAMMQEDVKKLVAYSSVSHLGFVMLGLFALTSSGVQGAIIQMVNHGLSTGALFLIVGVIYERSHTRLISDFGGLSKIIPLFAVYFMIVTLSSIGLPGLNGFVGEFLILVGTFVSENAHAKTYAVLAATGVILAACYMLWMFQRIMFGPLTREKNRALKDLNAREVVYLTVIVVFIVWIGVYPKSFLSRSQATVNHYIEKIEKGRRITEEGMAYKASLEKQEATDDEKGRSRQ